MRSIGKITRVEMLTLPNKKELLKRRKGWLKKQRKKDKSKAHRAYYRKLKKLGYKVTRDLQAFCIRIFKNNYVICVVKELKSGEVKVYDKFHQEEYKKLDGARKGTKHFAKCGNGKSIWWCKYHCEKRKNKECHLVR